MVLSRTRRLFLSSFYCYICTIVCTTIITPRLLVQAAFTVVHTNTNPYNKLQRQTIFDYRRSQRIIVLTAKKDDHHVGKTADDDPDSSSMRLPPLPLDNVDDNLFDSNNASPGSATNNKNGKANKNDKNGVENDVSKLLDFPSFSDVGDNDNMGTNDFSSSSYVSPLEGVLPVSELFYRSTQSIEGEEESEEESAIEQDPDDEELPFSAEQTNSLESNCNKVQVRRNQAAAMEEEEEEETSEKSEKESENASEKNKKSSKRSRKRSRARLRKRKKTIKKPVRSDTLIEVSSLFVQEDKVQQQKTRKSRGKGGTNNRKMVRRGMEMLVGGEPINADPPLRVVDIHYDQTTDDWAKVVTLNSRDFGPLMHTQSVSKISDISRGLYSEYFVKNALKWDICPPDLSDIVNWYEKMTRDSKNSEMPALKSYSALLEMMTSKIEEKVEAGRREQNAQVEENMSNFGDDVIREQQAFDATEDEDSDVESSSSSSGRGFAPKEKSTRRQSSLTKQSNKDDLDYSAYALQSELKFSLAVSRDELGSGEGGGFKVLQRILTRGLETAIDLNALGCYVRIGKLVVTEEEDESEIDICFDMFTKSSQISPRQRDKLGSRINQALALAVDSGDMVMALARSTREERAWSPHLKAKVISEMIMDNENYAEDIGVNDDEDEEYQQTIVDKMVSGGVALDEPFGEKGSAVLRPKNEEMSGPFGKSDNHFVASDDLFLGGGNGGVFSDYSEGSQLKSPFSGKLGPLLQDAIVERAKQNKPRVIAIGDVHGCLDELQALLRRCDYHPGDVVIFLGDLVSKGPDSASVVQMAREIGAIGVRGNHDFEVIRWHQAIKSGADPPVVGSDHYNIASKLDIADLKWLYSLPWYLSSKELNALFVHAGFVSGIRLAKQNPRLMMNMRSILPDGTVTSKFFNNWPWARLWDGPQTVFFGHDADRGLQQYEHAIGLDTGCVYGGRLSACILPEKRLVSVSAKREYFQYRRKHFD